MPNKRRGNKKGRPNGGRRSGQAMIALSMSDMNERQLAVRKDRVSLRGKVYSVVNTTVGIGVSPLLPAALGERVTALSNLFARWRILKLVIRNFPTSTSTGTEAFGLIDDDSAEGGSAPLPADISQVVALRCSVSGLSTVNPSELQWNPIDPTKWYYTHQGGAASDPRWVVPASLAVAAATTVSAGFAFIIYFTIEFEGAYAPTD